jgi:outer membrane protein TolC
VFAQNAWSQNAKLTLDDVKKFAVVNNFGIKAADAEIQEIRAQTQQRKSLFYPRLSFTAGPEIHQDPTINRPEALFFIEGSWNIFRGSQDRILTELSLLNEQVAESGRRKAQFELELEIEGLFYAYLNASSKIRFYDASLELNERHRRLMRIKQQSGMASQADMMEFELRESYIKSSMASLKQEREEARLGLVRLMGPKIEAGFEPYGALPHVHLKRSLEEFLSRINTNSESVKAASLTAAGGAVSQRAARAGWLPTVDVDARYGRLSQDVANAAPAFEGTLLFRWEMFSGFETTAKISEAKAKRERLDAEFRQKLLTTMTAAEVNYLKLNSIQERVHFEIDNEKKAVKYYEAVAEEYKRGVKNGLDLKNAEVMLLESRIRATDFKFAFIDTKNRLEKEVGLFIETEAHTVE